MHAHYCRCNIYVGSAIDVSDEDGAHTVSDETKEAWEALLVPSSSSHRDPNRAPTVVAPSTPVPPDEEAPSIPETPRFDPEQGGTPPEEPVVGIATKIVKNTGIEACPKHQMDHGVRDPNCDHCKRALGPLYHHNLRKYCL